MWDVSEQKIKMKGYDKNNTCVHFLNYHYIWCTKYRKKLIIGNIEKMYKKLIFKKCYELGCKVIAIETMPDHTHVLLQTNPQHNPIEIVQHIKGFTSFVLRKEFPSLKRLPTLWTRSYFISTHGHVSNITIQKYIGNQKKNIY